jgi:hypothetical protein
MIRALALASTVLLSGAVAQADTLWSVSAVQELQHTSLGYGLNLRAAYRYYEKDSLGLIVRASAVPEDFHGFFAIAFHAALNLRHPLAWRPGYDLTPFVGGSLGAGFWTTCVWPERCGGSGPSLGFEAGASKPISKLFRLLGSFQVDGHSSLFTGAATISVVSLNLGIEY